MSVLTPLQPQPLWDIFAKICSIPHPSHHEEALVEHIMAFAKQNNWWVARDAVGNVLIRKPASVGMENRQKVVLQAHLDMVPQKNNDTVHDFVNDAIVPRIDGAWVKATGTTLGSDNGIGMASCLAVLADKTVEHGPIEVLLTMTEETGMDGAFGLASDWIEADILINTDSEEEGEIYMGCAGGVDVTTTLAISREALGQHDVAVEIIINGLRGGHSGGDVHLGLGNANKLLARLLAGMGQVADIRLLDLNGGTLRNAIAREASAIVAIAADKVSECQAWVSQQAAIFAQELAVVDAGVNIVFNTSDAGAMADKAMMMLSQQSHEQVVNLINAMPHGVVRMSDVARGVVETSLNVGVITMRAESIEIIALVRSLIESGKEAVVSHLQSLADLVGAELMAEGDYPGWEPDADSAVMHLVKDTYQGLFGKTPNIMVIHAGLECGLFKKPYPHMDMVSIGPTIRGAHSPDERVHIESVGRYWQLLTAVLRNIPVKA